MTSFPATRSSVTPRAHWLSRRFSPTQGRARNYRNAIRLRSAFWESPSVVSHASTRTRNGLLLPEVVGIWHTCRLRAPLSLDEETLVTAQSTSRFALTKASPTGPAHCAYTPANSPGMPLSPPLSIRGNSRGLWPPPGGICPVQSALGGHGQLDANLLGGSWFPGLVWDTR